MFRPLFPLAAALASALVANAAQSTISATNHYAWSGNTGWIDFRSERPNASDGFRFGEFSCSGFLWSANLGWINCGTAPTNGVYYVNDNGTDFGVNHYGTGDLYGMAWAANVGWINFGWWTLDPTNANRPHVDLTTGQFSGYVWSANCGWINLGSGQLKTDRMIIVDTDGDGISDAFEMGYAGNLSTMNGSSDLDGDGISDRSEYISGTNPLVPNGALVITRISKLAGLKAVELEWPSTPARVYGLEVRLNLADPDWILVGDVAGAAGTNKTTAALEAGGTQAYFRIAVKLPLQP